MKNIRTALVHGGLGGFALIYLTTSVTAQQAVVVSPGSNALETGQAFLINHSSRCYAVMPTHVARQQSQQSLRREGARRVFGELGVPVDLGDDVSLSPVLGISINDCGPSSFSIDRSVDRHLQRSGLATLRSVNGDGTTAQMSVAIVDYDGVSLLRVQPTHASNQIRKGLSGSQLKIDDAVVGMLVSVNARSGIGTVVRQDVVMSKVDLSLAKQQSAGMDSQPSSFGDAAGGLVEIAAWNNPPQNPEYSASNLTSPGTSGSWRSTAEDWPVTLDFALKGKSGTWSGIILDGRGVPEEELPGMVEVFTNLDGTPRGWRSITSTAPDYRDGVATIGFAPRRGQLIRFSIARPIGAGRTVSLRRVSAKVP